jgi:hypothetical protein
MKNAISIFSGTELEGKMIIINANILTASGDITAALNQLSSVSNNQQ